MTLKHKETNEESDPFPIANTRRKRSTSELLASKMWWLTLVCIVVACVLAWQSIPQIGPQITISFPQGHGLKTGDPIRHRGIDVGLVETVSLNSDLNGILVTAVLNPQAAVLCRQDTRFWIVRPNVGLTGINGLETLVGSRYIAVSPGTPDAARQRTFDGLTAAPPDELSGKGLELILQADGRGGLNPGAPLTWRGVPIGQVLTIGLSPDATHVNVGVRISTPYRELVRSNSKFWITSGLGVHIGLSGIDLTADSLASLTLGGISLTTPAAEQQTTPVGNGHLFVLHPRPDDSWMKNAAAIPLFDAKLPDTVTIEGKTDTSFLGFRRDKPFTVSGLLLRDGQQLSLLTATLPHEPTKAATLPELHIRQTGTGDPFIVSTANISALAEEASGLQLLSLSDLEPGDPVHSAELLRNPKQPEECCVCRTVFGDGESKTIIHSIGSEQLAVRDGIWMLSDNSDLSGWKGAPVVAYDDGRVIGVLVATEQGTAVAPVTTASGD